MAILITCPKEEYMEQREALMKKGMKEWKDFKWYRFEDKKVCLISANCHGPVLEQFLLTQKSFTDCYAIHPFMAHGGYMREGMHTPLDDELLAGVDLLLYQHMRLDNVMSVTYADENILPKVSSNCECVSIPNYYPLGGGIYQTQTTEVLKDARGCDAFYRDELLDLAFSKIRKKDIKSILSFLDDYEMNLQEVETKAQSFIERLERREATWDIKVLNWLTEAYRSLPLFNDIGHPSAEFMWETGRRLMLYLGLQIDEGKRQEYINSYRLGLGGVVPSSVIRGMGIKKNMGVRWGVRIDHVKEYLTGRIEICPIQLTVTAYLQNYYLIRYGQLLPYVIGLKISIDEEDVVEGYRMFLERVPENDSVVESKLAKCHTLQQLREEFLTSSEFQEKYKGILVKH